MDRKAFFRSQRPVFYAAKAFGLAPFNYDESGKTPKMTFSRFWFGYMLLLNAFYIYTFVLSVENCWVIPMQRNYPFISVVGHMMHIFLSVVICILIYSLNSLKSKSFSMIMSKLLLVDEELHRIGHPLTDIVDFNQIKKYQTIVLLAAFVCQSSLIIYDVFVFLDIYGSFVGIIIFAYALPYSCAGLIQCQFIVMTYSVYQRFEVINSFLTHIVKTNENYTKIASPGEEKEVEKDDAVKVNQREFLGKDEKPQLDPNLHTKMNEIFIIHDYLSDTAELVNNTFSVQTVTVISGCFVIVIFGLFFETKVLFWAGSIKLILISTSYLLWGTLSSAFIYFLLSTCTMARDSANKSALIIHKILQMKPQFMLNDEIFYNKMKSFTLQILHKKNVHFNGLGLFRLDYTFIFSAVSAATSYLIVLLQFDLTQDFEKFVQMRNG